MIDLLKYAAAESAGIDKAIEEIREILKDAPPGSLLPERRGGHWVYRAASREGTFGRERRYVSLRDRPLLAGLAEKKYLSALLTSLEEESRTLREFTVNYDPERKYRVYRELSEGIKRLTRPYMESPEDICARWAQEDWARNREHPETLRFETSGGEMVRSKSEVIIADMLRSAGIAYRYEQRLQLAPGFCFYPDFTIMRKSDCAVFYWEHLGMLGDPGYAENCVRKLNMYARAGITPADRLLISWECLEVPFDRTIAKEYVKKLLQ